MQRDLWIRNVEIVLVIPATLFMLPMAAFASLGMLFALAQEPTSPMHGTVAFLVMLRVLIAFLAGIVGFVSLWAALVIPACTFMLRPALRIGIACGILIGIADAAYWFWPSPHHGHRHTDPLGFSGWAVWLLMLIAPLAVGIHRLIRLIALKNSPSIHI